MIRRTQSTTRTYTLFPYTTLFRSKFFGACDATIAQALEQAAEPGDQPYPGYDLDRDQRARYARSLSVYRHPCERDLHQPPTSGGERLDQGIPDAPGAFTRSEEHTSELQSLMRISSADFSLTK